MIKFSSKCRNIVLIICMSCAFAAMAATKTFKMLKIIDVKASHTAHPFGDHRTVDQAFPGAISAEDADPFLMCDDYAMESKGAVSDPDRYPVDWHPHKGQDVLSYLKSGIGRHADSLGNRETYMTPGMQWMSAGSGVYHAEGGGTPKGVLTDGFQIWVNVPAKEKMNDPRYGTVPPDDLKLEQLVNGAYARVLAGELNPSMLNASQCQLNHSIVGSFKTVQPVLMIDFEIDSNCALSLSIPQIYDNCLVYVYKGSGTIQEQNIKAKTVVRLDAQSESDRTLSLAASGVSGEGMHALLFAGKRLNEPIAWHGPIVMNTKDQLVKTFEDLQNGAFPPKRVPWDYRKISEFPEHIRSQHSEL